MKYRVLFEIDYTGQPYNSTPLQAVIDLVNGLTKDQYGTRRADVTSAQVLGITTMIETPALPIEGGVS